MTTSRSVRILSVVLCVAVLFSCRRDGGKSCSEFHAFRDSVGDVLERERIEVQWAQVKGRLDSLLATRPGALAWERAPRSLEDDAFRYGDTLESDGEALRFRNGCTDWNATWADGRFDRLALATAMVRPLLADTTASALKVEADTATVPGFLDVYVLLSTQAQKSVRIELDTVEARLIPRP